MCFFCEVYIKEKFRLVLGNDKNTKAPLIINVNEFVIYFSLVLVFLLFALAGLGVFHTYSEISSKIAYKEVESKNKKLVHTLKSLKERVKDEAGLVEVISQLETDLSLHYGISPTPEAIKKQSIGGRATISDKARMMLGSPLEKSIAVVEEDIAGNKRQVDFLNTRLENIREEADRQSNYFSEKPSIFPVTGRVTSEFGTRIHPILEGYVQHQGIDIANSMWMPIKAPADGIVVFSGVRNGFGNFVEIEHRRSGYTTRYAHLAESKVKAGDRVKRGDIIASLGNTGLSTGPHLHYEVRRDGKALNPRQFLISSESNIIID